MTLGSRVRSFVPIAVFGCTTFLLGWVFEDMFRDYKDFQQAKAHVITTSEARHETLPKGGWRLTYGWVKILEEQLPSGMVRIVECGPPEAPAKPPPCRERQLSNKDWYLTESKSGSPGDKR